MTHNILAFDTSTEACSVALRAGDKIRTIHQLVPMQQAKLVLPMIHELLESLSLRLTDLDVIAYGAGPGRFTGTRIAMCVAQGISFAIHKPLMPISSLAALAQAAYLEQQWTKQLVAVDAQAGQIYWGIYEANDAGQMILQGEEQTCAPQEIDLNGINSNTAWYGIGDAWAKYQYNLLAHIGFCPQIINGPQRPTAEAILKLAEFNLIRSQ